MYRVARERQSRHCLPELNTLRVLEMATSKVSAFSIRGADGLPIQGNVHSARRSGDPRASIVICHGFKGFKDWGMFPVIADRLARAGFTAVRFNFSGAGVSDGDAFDQPERFREDTYSRQLTDLGNVLDWLGEPAVGVLGHSRGGAVSILRAATDARIVALVTWAAIADPMRWDDATVAAWRRAGTLDIVNARTGEKLPLGTNLLDDLERHPQALDIEAAAARLAVPWLIVHGRDDEAVPVEEATRLAASGQAPSRTLAIVEGGSHTFGAAHPWAGATSAFDEAMDASVRWFGLHLLHG